MNRAWRALLLLVILVAPGCARFLVDRIAFQPATVDASLRVRLPEGVEEIGLEAADGTKIQAFFVARSDSKKALLFMHGNAGHAYQRIPHAVKLAEAGANVLLLSYRGYGKSEGSPTEAGVYEDAEAALRYLETARGFPVPETFILGRSIGSAVGVHVAQKKPLGGLILVTPLSSGRDVARAHGLGWLGWMIGHPFDSVSKLENLSCPILIIHGDKDRITPFSQAEKIYESYDGIKSFRVARGAGHNNLVAVVGAAYWQLIGDFLEQPDALP